MEPELYLVDLYHFTTIDSFLAYCRELTCTADTIIYNMYGKKIKGDSVTRLQTVVALSKKQNSNDFSKYTIEQIALHLQITKEDEKKYLETLWYFYSTKDKKEQKRYKELIIKQNKLPRIFDYEDSFRLFIRDYISAKQGYCSFSNRHICRLLSPKSRNGTYIQELLEKGKKLTDDRVIGFTEKIFYFSRLEKEYFKKLVDYEQEEKEGARAYLKSELSTIKRQYFADALYTYGSDELNNKIYYPIIALLIDIYQFKENDFSEIYRHIPTSIKKYIEKEIGKPLNPEKKKIEKVTSVITHLRDLQWVEVQNGFYHLKEFAIVNRKDTPFETEIRDLAHKFNKDTCRLGKTIAPATMAISTNGYREIKKLAKNFQLEAMKVIQEDNNPEEQRRIYSMLFQLFPLE